MGPRVKKENPGRTPSSPTDRPLGVPQRTQRRGRRPATLHPRCSFPSTARPDFARVARAAAHTGGWEPRLNPSWRPSGPWLGSCAGREVRARDAGTPFWAVNGPKLTEKEKTR